MSSYLQLTLLSMRRNIMNCNKSAFLTLVPNRMQLHARMAGLVKLRCGVDTTRDWWVWAGLDCGEPLAREAIVAMRPIQR